MRQAERCAIRLTLAVAAWTACCAASPAAEITADDEAFFEKQVRPLLVARCYQCHGDLQEPKGGLRLTSREAILKGGDSGPAAVPGRAAESRLIAAINYDGLEMPPEGKKLAGEQIATLTRWVERGLSWPRIDPAAEKSMRRAAEADRIAAAQRAFWSLQPLADPPLPVVKDRDWPRVPLDYFVLVRLEQRGSSPRRRPIAPRCCGDCRST